MGSCMGHGRKNQGREMTDRTHPDSGRIVTSGDVINDLHDEIAQLRGTRKVLWDLLGECLPVIDALMQMPGDDDSDAHLNGLAGRINDARITELAQRFGAADMATAAAQGFRDGVASAASWISVDARLPEPNTPVLLDIGKMFPLRALWAGKHTVRVGTDVDDWGEYDEETDEYYCPEGWYEWNEHEEVHWAVSETPRAWRELPPPLPAAPGPAEGESNG